MVVVLTCGPVHDISFFINVGRAVCVVQLVQQCARQSVDVFLTFPWGLWRLSTGVLDCECCFIWDNSKDFKDKSLLVSTSARLSRLSTRWMPLGECSLLGHLPDQLGQLSVVLISSGFQQSPVLKAQFPLQV